MVTRIEQIDPESADWQCLCQQLQQAPSLARMVIVGRQMGLWLGREIVEQELNERAQVPTQWDCCCSCGSRLVSKGFVGRQQQTLLGKIEWKRRVGRCPHRCLGSERTPLDEQLGIYAFAQTSVELQRLGCLLAVFLPFALAVELLAEFTGIGCSDSALWNWVQRMGQATMEQLQQQLNQFEQAQEVEVELLEESVQAMTLVIAADGVNVPFRAQSGSPKGKIRFQEVKVAILARLHQTQTQAGQVITRLRQRRFVAVLGEIDQFKPRLQLEAHRQGIITAKQVVWISDGARGFWRLDKECFAHCAVGILDFYHAAQHLWDAAQAYQDTLPHRSAKQWFEQLRHRLRRGAISGLIREFHALSRYASTPEAARPILCNVRDYLNTHLDHLRYRVFKQLGFPIGSGMVESACKWLIQQRFKGTGMRWSEPGFNHLLHLRLAWVNHRFDSLFSDQDLTLSLYSPKR